jgi:hypothetical protein
MLKKSKGKGLLVGLSYIIYEDQFILPFVISTMITTCNNSFTLGMIRN